SASRPLSEGDASPFQTIKVRLCSNRFGSACWRALLVARKASRMDLGILPATFLPDLAREVVDDPQMFGHHAALSCALQLAACTLAPSAAYPWSESHQRPER